MIGPEDTASLLAIYGVTGLERERLLAMARDADLSAWWDRSGDRLPDELPALINFEAEAVRIVHVAMLRIPGLMQIPEYARAVVASLGVFGSDLESMVSTRLGRQAVLTRPRPPRYLAIIDEAALRRPVGSARVMAEQLRHMSALAVRPNIDIRVIPYECGAHVGLDGAYVLMEFPKAQPIVHLEHLWSSLFLDEPEDVGPFQEATDTLMAGALGSADSVDFLARVAADFERK